MKLLALDTATERIALGLAVGPASFVVDAEGGAAASAQLIPQVLALLAQHGLRVVDLDAIAFGQGPGAFTGLRTAVSVAQGLAFGADKPVLPIDSLLIVAEDARVQWLAGGGRPASEFEVWVTMDARMGEVYAAAYAHAGEAAGGHGPAEGVAGDTTTADRGWRVCSPPALYDLPTLHQAWSTEPPVAVTGSALGVFGERLQFGAARTWPQPLDRAAALLRLARAAWQAGAARPAEEALPVYLRDKVALTTAERQAQRVADQRPPVAAGTQPSVD